MAAIDFIRVCDHQVLEKAIRPDTVLVSIMTVNNEIGVRQPIEEIGKLCRANKVFFHTDAAQAVGKVPIDVNDQHIDLMSISGHKIYGPKGGDISIKWSNGCLIIIIIYSVSEVTCTFAQDDTGVFFVFKNVLNIVLSVGSQQFN